MKKVTIEITEDGWETTIHLDGKKYVEKHKASSHGAQSVGEFFEDNKEISDNLYDALEGLSQYDVMRALEYEN